MTSIESLLIGEGSVLVRCAEVLMVKGRLIKALVSSDPMVRSWAMKGGVQHYELDEAVCLGPELEFDLLLSIGNYNSSLLRCCGARNG